MFGNDYNNFAEEAHLFSFFSSNILSSICFSRPIRQCREMEFLESWSFRTSQLEHTYKYVKFVFIHLYSTIHIKVASQMIFSRSII